LFAEHSLSKKPRNGPDGRRELVNAIEFACPQTAHAAVKLKNPQPESRAMPSTEKQESATPQLGWRLRGLEHAARASQDKFF
jgi:hypothetical protein